MPRIRSERPAFEKHYPALRERLEREAHFGRPKEPLLPPPHPERGERRGDPATDPSAG
jgi:cytochrome c oxidase subunit 1